MRKDPDLIFISGSLDSWYVDHDINQFVAHEDAPADVKKAVARLNAKLAEDRRRGEHRF